MAAKSILKSSKETLIDAGVGLIGGGILGAAIGKFSLIAGLPVAIYGEHKNNRWARALGMGMILANGYQATGSPTNGLNGEEDIYGMEGVDGIDFKAMQQGATARIGAYFKGFRNKLLIPAMAAKGTNGLGEGEVSYFSNPYNGMGEGEYTTMAGDLGEGEDPAFFNGVVGSVGAMNGATSGLSGTGSVW